MPLPDASAASAPPFAVLLLAWDEAAPAVRALIEATQAPAPPLPGALVIVPAGAAPPDAAAVPQAATEPVAPATAATEPVAAVAEPTEPAPTVANAPPPATATPAAPSEMPRAALPPAEPAASPAEASPLLPAVGTPPTPTSSPVRLVRLSSLSLPELAAQAGQPLPAPVWAGPAGVPAVPYLGASAAPAAAAATSAAVGERVASASQQLPDEDTQTAPELPAAPGLPPVAAFRSATHLTLANPPQPAAGGAPLLVPGHLAPPPFFSSPTEEPDAPLNPDFPAIGPAMPALEPETGEFSTVSEEPASPPVPAGPAAWVSALASLQQPAELPAATPEPDGPASHAVLGPPGPLPTAPDLNFQIIQYARFAVPVALAEQPFAVLYAPSWPTWLAAQELRQRTGCPLVLHVEALAAGPESADTATGWVAELQRQALRRADLVLTETHALASRLRRELGLPAHAVRVVPATDTARIARALKRVQVYVAGGPAEAEE